MPSCLPQSSIVLRARVVEQTCTSVLHGRGGPDVHLWRSTFLWGGGAQPAKNVIRDMKFQTQLGLENSLSPSRLSSFFFYLNTLHPIHFFSPASPLPLLPLCGPFGALAPCALHAGLRHQQGPYQQKPALPVWIQWKRKLGDGEPLDHSAQPPHSHPHPWLCLVQSSEVLDSVCSVTETGGCTSPQAHTGLPPWGKHSSWLEAALHVWGCFPQIPCCSGPSKLAVTGKRYLRVKEKAARGGGSITAEHHSVLTLFSRFPASTDLEVELDEPSPFSADARNTM